MWSLLLCCKYVTQYVSQIIHYPFIKSNWVFFFSYSRQKPAVPERAIFLFFFIVQKFMWVTKYSKVFNFPLQLRKISHIWCCITGFHCTGERISTHHINVQDQMIFFRCQIYIILTFWSTFDIKKQFFK